MADLCGVSTDISRKEEDSIAEPSENLEGVSAVEDTEDAMAKNGVSPGPITPDTERENGDFPLDLNSPPSLVASPEKVVCVAEPFDSVNLNSPRTPKDGVFDPFAPGPDELALAPICKKHLCKPLITVARRLSFSSTLESEEDESFQSDTDTLSDEEMLLESVYGSLLDAIVSIQSEEVFLGISSPELDSDGFNTPPSAPRLTGVAETCPDAPLKPTRKLRSIDKGLCRKLDFDLLDV